MEGSFTISTTTSQPSCKVFTIVQGYKHLAQIATTLLQTYKVAARLLQPSYFHMGWLPLLENNAAMTHIRSISF